MSTKKRVWLTSDEVNHLGLKSNRVDPKRNKSQHTLSKQKQRKLQTFRAANIDVVSESVTSPNDYPAGKVLSAWNYKTGKMMNLDQYCKHYGLPREDVTSHKLVSHTGTPYFNIVFKERVLDADEVEKEIDFDSIISKYIKPIKHMYNGDRLGFKSGEFDRLVYTDVHIGMETNSNGHSLYGGKWNEKEVNNRLTLMVNHVLTHQKSDTLIVDELGDFMDGWNSQTTRMGHELPQNMDNEKAFDVGLSFKIRLMDALIPHYKKIIFHNICNDNHAGSFGYVVNRAFKSVAAARYPDIVEVVNMRKFLSHYFIAGKCFILTHGKDAKHLKFGFKPILDSKQIEKIKDYMDEHEILFKCSEVEFSKGDSHQFIFDDSTSDSFNYYNYPAMSPSSEWVQTNFKKGKSGIVFFNFNRNGTKSQHPLMFKWVKGINEKENNYDN